MNEIDKRINEPKNQKVAANSFTALANCTEANGIKKSDLCGAIVEDAPAIIDFIRGEIRKERKDLFVELLNENESISEELKAFKETASEMLVDVRNFRMTVTREIKESLITLGDIRKFFLSPEHFEETKRLAEFVLLCERLDALKRSGVLDAVADTIIRLELKSEAGAAA